MNIFYMGSTRNKNRTACMSDLEYYFKRSDLLGGLTGIQQAKLRRNIGVAGVTYEKDEDGNYVVVEQITQRRTYEGLLTDIREGIIVVGSRYIITDFQSIYSSNNIVNGVPEVWGLDINPSEKYELIVTGIHTNMIDSRAYIIGKDWEVEYDITQEILSGGIKTKGKITWLRDSNGNSAHYDFKNIKFKRTKEELFNYGFNVNKDYVPMYTFSSLTNGVSEDRSEESSIRYNELKLNSWNNVFIGDTRNNTFEPGFKNNTFVGGCVDCHFLWESENNTFKGRIGRTTGTIQNKIIELGTDALAVDTTKYIHIVTGATIVTYLDPTTYSQQIIKID